MSVTSTAPRNTVVRDRPAARRLYSDAERARRDGTRWTLVQGILAPVQFVVFLVSLGLVLRYLVTGAGY